MFNDLPQLFGKGFIVGYALPALLFIASMALISDFHGLSMIYASVWKYLVSGSDKLPIGEVVLTIATVWILGSFLLGMNYTLTRVLEGYGSLNPARLLVWLQIRRFRKLESTVSKNSAKPNAKYAVAATILSAKFPENSDLVLGTAFGNTLRAAERYPQVVYSIETLSMWPRVTTVIPDAHRDALREGKSSLDLWVNVWALALLIVSIEFLVFDYWLSQPVNFLIIICGLMTAFAASHIAKSAAEDFGALIRTTFDLYRTELAAQLGLTIPNSVKEEREMWTVISQTMLYRDQDRYGDIEKYRKK